MGEEIIKSWMQLLRRWIRYQLRRNLGDFLMPRLRRDLYCTWSILCHSHERMPQRCWYKVGQRLPRKLIYFSLSTVVVIVIGVRGRRQWIWNMNVIQYKRDDWTVVVLVLLDEKMSKQSSLFGENSIDSALNIAKYVLLPQEIFAIILLVICIKYQSNQSIVIRIEPWWSDKLLECSQTACSSSQNPTPDSASLYLWQSPPTAKRLLHCEEATTEEQLYPPGSVCRIHVVQAPPPFRHQHQQHPPAHQLIGLSSNQQLTIHRQMRETTF